MVVIRLARAGSKKRPFYHVVVADKRFSRGGRYIENVGYFNPVARGANTRIRLNREAMQGWIGKGAQPSDRVKALMAEFDKAGSESVTAEAKDAKLAARQDKRAQVKAAAEKAKLDAEAAEKAKAEAEEAPAEEPKAAADTDKTDGDNKAE